MQIAIEKYYFFIAFLFAPALNAYRKNYGLFYLRRKTLL